MLKDHRKSRIVVVGLLILVLLQACRLRTGSGPGMPVSAVGVITEGPTESAIVPTRRVETPTIVPTQIASTPTSSARVTVTAIEGNLYIRRGPDLAFNPVGVLHENSVAEVTARDVLSQWAQIVIPDSEDSGWVSLQTRHSEIQGDLQTLPDLTPTDWPVPAYLRNCTYHQMVVLPGDIILPSLLESPENEVWIYPGSYGVHDLDHPDVPEVERVEIREGISIDIRVDGNGDKRKCP